MKRYSSNRCLCLFLVTAVSCTDGDMFILNAAPSVTDTGSDVDTNPDCMDRDGDGQCDEDDPCPDDVNNDLDSDGLCANWDNCVAVANPDQADMDSDGLGDSCDPCPDVSDKSQVPFGNEPGSLPGLIELEHFDEGGQCISYFDIDEEQRGPTDIRIGEWIDLHYETVEVPGDYVIGFTYETEWVEYTVNAQEGMYDIELRYSSETETKEAGETLLLLNEALLGTFEQPDTGLFTEWTSAHLTGVPIPETTAGTLRLYFKVKYFNYTWIEFTKR